MGNVPRRLVALLRGINVGGHRVRMDHLRDLFAALGFHDVATFIASGNVIFSAEATDVRPVEARIEEHLKGVLGYEVATFLRTPAELAAIASHRPFDDGTGQTLHVGFLRDPLDEARGEALRALETERDAFAFRGREVYWRCLGKTTESLVSWPLVARTIGVPSTMRNVRTVRALAAKYGVSG